MGRVGLGLGPPAVLCCNQADASPSCLLAAPHPSALLSSHVPPCLPPAAGAYVVDNGRLLMLWLGQALSPSFYAQVFGVQGPPQDASGACECVLLCGPGLGSQTASQGCFLERTFTKRHAALQLCDWEVGRRSPTSLLLTSFLVPPCLACRPQPGASAARQRAERPHQCSAGPAARQEGAVAGAAQWADLGCSRGGKCCSHPARLPQPSSCSPPAPPQSQTPPASGLQECWVVRQGTPMEAHLMPYLVEDRQAAAGSMGYLDYMMQVQKMLMAKA